MSSSASADCSEPEHYVEHGPFVLFILHGTRRADRAGGPQQLTASVSAVASWPAACMASSRTRPASTSARSATCRRSRPPSRSTACLLYTSDAADDLLCVDLGGRRIIK